MQCHHGTLDAATVHKCKIGEEMPEWGIVIARMCFCVSVCVSSK